MTKKCIAVVAGAGLLPCEVIEKLQAKGQDEVLVFGLRGVSDETLERYQPHWLRWGQIGFFLKRLHAAGCARVILIGAVPERPDFLSSLGDWETLKRLPRLLALLSDGGGDDAVLRSVITLFEEEGIRIIGVQEVLPELLVPRGLCAGPPPSAAARQDITLGIHVAQTIGRLDIGQSVVTLRNRVIAVEAAEGTDALLERVRALKAQKRIPTQGRCGVLVKCVKPGQDVRLDLPSIGLKTLEGVHAAGLAGCAVSAERVLFAQKEASLAYAGQHGLFLEGITGMVNDEL